MAKLGTSRIKRVTVGATSVFGALLAVLLAVYVWHDYRRTLDAARIRLHGEAYALVEQADSLLRFGSGALASTRQQIVTRGGLARMSEKELHELFVSQIQTFSRDVSDIPMHAFFAVSADGQAIAASTGFPVKRVDTRDREYFRHFSTSTDKSFHLSQISHSRLTGLAVVFLTTGIYDESGNFAGIVGLSLRLRHFEDYYRNRGFRSGQTMLMVRTDGKPVFRHPMTDEFPDSDVSTHPDFLTMVRERSGLIEAESPYDNKYRLIAFRAAERFPLLAIVSEPKTDTLAPWRTDALVATSVWLAFYLALALMLRFALRQVAAAGEAAAANAAKSRFLAMMSHEIRTPLNGILGMAQLLQLPKLDDSERREFARTIVDSGRSLLTLLNDVLDLAKIEAGHVEFDPVAANPATVIGETAALFRELARGKNLLLTADTFCVPGRHYLIDAVRLRQMLSNLVSNGIKFTEHGRVSIECREAETRGHRAILEFSVADTGIGIAPELLKKLFQPFTQLDAGLNRRQEGTGLGLSIVRNLAEAMGGTTGVESSPGKGSRFWFTIQADIVPQSEHTASPHGDDRTTSAMNPEAPAILIADDDAINRKVIEALLKRLGFPFVSVHNGQQAFDIVASGAAIALVLMDLDMPELDGCTATELIRGLEMASGRPRIPILGVSAHAFDEDRQRAVDAGMDDFIAKPIGFDEFRTKVERMLARQTMPTQ